jgi:hypothetical protein
MIIGGVEAGEMPCKGLRPPSAQADLAGHQPKIMKVIFQQSGFQATAGWSGGNSSYEVKRPAPAGFFL